MRSYAVISHVRCQNVSDLAGAGGPVEVRLGVWALDSARAFPGSLTPNLGL